MMPSRCPAMPPRGARPTSSRDSPTWARSTVRISCAKRPTKWCSSISTRPTSAWPTPAARRPCPPPNAATAAPVPDSHRGRPERSRRRRVDGSAGGVRASSWRVPGRRRWWCAPCPNRCAAPIRSRSCAKCWPSWPRGHRSTPPTSSESIGCLATIACHSVVRAGDVLGRAEALALLAQLDEVDLRSHCPHGRPVVLRLPLGEIERRFGRG